MQKSARNVFPVVLFLYEVNSWRLFWTPNRQTLNVCYLRLWWWFAEYWTRVECSALSVGKYVFINQNGITFRNTVSINHWVDVLAYRIAIFRHFAKWWKVTVSFILFVCPSILLSLCSHGTTWLPPDGFLWSLICEYFLQIYEENSRFIKSDKNNKYFTWKTIYIFYFILLSPS